MKEVSGFILALSVLAVVVDAHYKHECAVRFVRFRLNHEPAEYGLSAGEYEPGKKAYVGGAKWKGMSLAPGRIQLHPPGIWTAEPVGPGNFISNPNDIWYLSPRRGHHYRWVRSRNGNRERNAIDVGTEVTGTGMFIGRIRVGNSTFLGIVAEVLGELKYVDNEGMTRRATCGYDVLTCYTWKHEAKIPLPQIVSPDAPPNADTGCINSWLPYNNDNEPETSGISAGTHACGNEAYVGKSTILGLSVPGRIQTVGDAGFYALSKNNEIRIESDSFYLADNPQYTYRWAPFDFSLLPSAVFVRGTVGAVAIPVGRVAVNGRVRIGVPYPPVLTVANEAGNDTENFFNFEILTCDPFPQYKCGQQWKKLNTETGDSPDVDGFAFSNGFFIGRALQKCINGCDYGVGVFDTERGGVSYLDELRAEGAFESGSGSESSAEYLVQDASYSYRWRASRNGEKVPSALELQREGHAPFYIGRARINDDVFVGKVRPGEGLFFVDRDNQQKTTSSYEVLTCGSPYPHDGLYEERSDWSWFGDFGCPVRKEWSFQKRRCVCREEFKNFLTSAGAVWSEDTCSYA